MAGLTFGREGGKEKKGSSSRWWVNDGRCRKDESKRCKGEGADTHLFSFSKCTVSSTRCWGSVLVEEALIEESFTLRTLSPLPLSVFRFKIKKPPLRGLNDLSSPHFSARWVTDRRCRGKAAYAFHFRGNEQGASHRHIRASLSFQNKQREYQRHEAVCAASTLKPVLSSCHYRSTLLLLARANRKSHYCVFVISHWSSGELKKIYLLIVYWIRKLLFLWLRLNYSSINQSTNYLITSWNFYDMKHD